MARVRRTFTPEFKRDAVRLVTAEGKTVSEVARNLGVARSLLQRWVEQHADQDGAGNPRKRKSHESEEIKKLRKQLRDTAEERDVPKKRWPTSRTTWSATPPLRDPCKNSRSRLWPAPATNLSSQQRKLDRFRMRYNGERPHDGIDGDLPDERWEPSPRFFPERLAPPEYPSHLEVRRVSAAGTFRLKAKQPFLSNALADEHIGLEEVGDGLWNIVYYKTLLGRIDERTRRITGVEV